MPNLRKLAIPWGPAAARTAGLISGGALIVGASLLGSPGGAVQAASPPAAPPAPEVQPAAVPPGHWVAQPTTVVLVWGDTLWGLAQTYGVSVAALQAANGLGQSTAIYAGATLAIPGRFLVSARGVTLSAVATSLRVPLGQLAALNSASAPSVGTIIWVPPQAASAAVAAGQSLADLAHLVQAEAGNQPFAGMVAVAAVVLNRVKSPGFPKSIAAVIFAPGQFESVQNGTFWQAPSAAAYQAAEAALAGEDPSGGALYFYNPALTTNTWIEGLPVVARIGQQVFSR